MLAGIVLGALAGTGWLTGSHAGQADVALGLLLMLYAGLGLTSVRFSVAAAAEWWLGPVVGLMTGVVTAATGVFAIPAVPYISALGLGKDELIQALGLSLPSPPSRWRRRSWAAARSTLAMSARRPRRSRPCCLAWRPAALCAAASARRRSGGCSS